MFKKALAIILTTLAIFSLTACELFLPAKNNDEVVTFDVSDFTKVESEVDTTVDTTELLTTEVGSSKEATIEDNFIMTDNSPNTEASDVSGEYVGTDEYTKSSHTVSELDTTVTTEEQVPEFDIWDGTVADGFAGGDGTENSPYQIAKASQLAFLAKSVNEGNLYADNYISLACDIDLNNIDWTPIGNGIQAFMGNFDGKDHTIKNLNISQSIHYTYEYPTGRKVPYCDSGLFTTVQDASIQNVIIDGVTIKIADAKSFNAHGGVLCGTVRTYQSTSVISNINIKNATITTEFSTKQYLERLSIGGAIGHIYAYNDTTTTISLIETDCMVSCINGYGYSNYIGTIIGSSNILDSTFVLENCAAYQTLSINPEQYYYTFTKDFCGAIGNAQASAKPFNVKNVFSKLTINKPDLDSAIIPPPAIVSHAIIGEAYYYALKDDPIAIGYEFENVFGCVEHVDTTGEKQIFTKLCELPKGNDFVQTNCQGCERLPDNHGFDTDIWNLDNLSKPCLK